MKKTITKGVFLFALFLTLLWSCQDKKYVDDINVLSETEIRFLNQDKLNDLKSGDSDDKQAFIQKITKDLERQNKEKHFIKKFVKNYGSPDWEMARWFQSNGEIVAQIPVFFDNGTETQAVILAVEYNNKLKFRLIVRDHFEKYAKNKKPKPTVQKIKDLFIIFDFWKFGESSYLYEGQSVGEYDPSSKLKSTSEWGEACYLIQAVFVNGELISTRWDCETYYIWYGDEMADPDEGGGDSGDWYDTSGGDPATTSCPEGYILDNNNNCVIDCNSYISQITNVINIEGGFVNDPIDPGGATNMGISWNVWTKNSMSLLGITPTLENLQNITENQAATIYKSLYWDKIKADEISDGDLRSLLFDFYVNAGANATKVLQKTLNNLGNNLVIDGIVGNNTLLLINGYENQIELYNNFKIERQNYYDNLANRSVNNYLINHPNASDSELLNKTLKRFITGWTNRVNEFINKTIDNYLNVNCN